MVLICRPGFIGIRTRIVGIEGEHADQLTTTTAQLAIKFFWTPIRMLKIGWRLNLCWKILYWIWSWLTLTSIFWSSWPTKSFWHSTSLTMSWPHQAKIFIKFKLFTGPHSITYKSTPRSSGYGRRLMSWRLWDRIRAPYTGWKFFHIYLL